MLSFNYLIQTEPVAIYDNATVEISTNGGSSFVIIAGNNQGAIRFTNNSSGLWRSISIGLSNYVGFQILLRFHFNTIDGIANNFEGWYVDDINVSGGGSSGPIPVSPTVTGNFSNGVWSGSISVGAPATNVTLRADDGNGHSGLSAAFRVINAPIFLTQPQSQTVLYGANASFNPVATGVPPLTYQWQKNGSTLTGAIGSTLQISNVSRLDQANYTLLVTNLYGSITSSNAYLRVLVPQLFSTVSVDSQHTVRLWFGDASGGSLANPTNIQIQLTTNLAGSNTLWATLSNSSLVISNGLLLFEDRGATNRPQTFYRVVEQQ
jgi:hypothetical protein